MNAEQFQKAIEAANNVVHADDFENIMSFYTENIEAGFSNDEAVDKAFVDLREHGEEVTQRLMSESSRSRKKNRRGKYSSKAF